MHSIILIDARSFKKDSFTFVKHEVFPVAILVSRSVIVHLVGVILSFFILFAIVIFRGDFYGEKSHMCYCDIWAKTLSSYIRAL